MVAVARGGTAAGTGGHGASRGRVPTSTAGSFCRFQGTVRRGSRLGGMGGGASWSAAATVGGLLASAVRAISPWPCSSVRSSAASWLVLSWWRSRITWSGRVLRYVKQTSRCHTWL
ncbi:hypothetical protein BJX66DRAFT_306594 [Aspergillus keveii]|uniref:Uncharacterized protein n=1 Tax=Aspergillus keveii TaxID=714993 RepID=A0ABR4G2H0_9EURO